MLSWTIWDLRQWAQELTVHGCIVLDTFCCTVMKLGNLLLRMKWGYVGRSLVWSGQCVGWDWLKGCPLMFFVIGWVLFVKIKDMITQSLLQCYGHVMRGDINSQILEVIKVEILGKRKQGWPRKSWEECVKKDLERYGLRREDRYGGNKFRERKNNKNCYTRQAAIMALKRTFLLLFKWYFSSKVTLLCKVT